MNFAFAPRPAPESDHCACEGTGWVWAGPLLCLDGSVRLLRWVACSDHNDDGRMPKPARAPMPLDAEN